MFFFALFVVVNMKSEFSLPALLLLKKKEEQISYLKFGGFGFWYQNFASDSPRQQAMCDSTSGRGYSIQTQTHYGRLFVSNSISINNLINVNQYTPILPLVITYLRIDTKNTPPSALYTVHIYTYIAIYTCCDLV